MNTDMNNNEDYSWHDRRKDKNDLPEKSGQYICLYDYLETSGYLMLYYIPTDKHMRKLWERVVAWKAFEPFEGVAND